MVKVETHRHIDILDFEREHGLEGFFSKIHENKDYPRNDSSVFDEVLGPESYDGEWYALSKVQREGYKILVDEYGFNVGDTIVWDFCW